MRKPKVTESLEVRTPNKSKTQDIPNYSPKRQNVPDSTCSQVLPALCHEKILAASKSSKCVLPVDEVGGRCSSTLSLDIDCLSQSSTTIGSLSPKVCDLSPLASSPLNDETDHPIDLYIADLQRKRPTLRQHEKNNSPKRGGLTQKELDMLCVTSSPDSKLQKNDLSQHYVDKPSEVRQSTRASRPCKLDGAAPIADRKSKPMRNQASSTRSNKRNTSGRRSSSQYEAQVAPKVHCV